MHYETNALASVRTKKKKKTVKKKQSIVHGCTGIPTRLLRTPSLRFRAYCCHKASGTSFSSQSCAPPASLPRYLPCAASAPHAASPPAPWAPYDPDHEHYRALARSGCCTVADIERPSRRESARGLTGPASASGPSQLEGATMSVRAVVVASGSGAKMQTQSAVGWLVRRDVIRV
ncbi:hypothetical protein EI94DRAFT_1749208 [Lactarius quietus]|nr:hypothetical protein EI94DRAFT_1749208 [Lactarius quietus]